MIRKKGKGKKQQARNIPIVDYFERQKTKKQDK